MKEWLIENTSISDNEYERIIGCDKDLRIEDASDEYILSHENALTMYNISNFTLDRKYKKEEFIKMDQYYYHRGVTFSILSDFYYDEFLETPRRFGKCHVASYTIAMNSDFDLMTMICTDFQSGKDFLHTILYSPDSDIIIDYTLNLIIDRETYFRMMNSRVVSIISNSKIKMLDERLRNSVDEVKQNVNVKELLCFPDEINDTILKFKKK